MRSRPPVVKTSDEFVQAVRDIHASRGPGDREFLRNILPPGKKVREVPADQWSSVLEAYWAGPRPASEPQNGIDPATWAGTAEGEFPTRSGLHEAARDLAVAGIPVFPCLPGAKQPACPNGFKDATTDLATIDRWWTENPNYNVAIYPEGAGYLIIDAERDGADDWLALKSEYKIPDTYTTRTPGGGRHYWFAGLGPSRVRIFGKSIDTRGRGGYILVPPSVVGNKSYKIVDDRDLAPLPEALRDAL